MSSSASSQQTATAADASAFILADRSSFQKTYPTLTEASMRLQCSHVNNTLSSIGRMDVNPNNLVMETADENWSREQCAARYFAAASQIRMKAGLTRQQITQAELHAMAVAGACSGHTGGVCSANFTSILMSEPWNKSESWCFCTRRRRKAVPEAHYLSQKKPVSTTRTRWRQHKLSLLSRERMAAASRDARRRLQVIPVVITTSTKFTARTVECSSAAGCAHWSARLVRIWSNTA